MRSYRANQNNNYKAKHVIIQEKIYVYKRKRQSADLNS